MFLKYLIFEHERSVLSKHVPGKSFGLPELAQFLKLLERIPKGYAELQLAKAGLRLEALENKKPALRRV